MSYLQWRLTFQIAILAATSTSLYAVDGVTLIDQNHALAGNIKPGDTPGFPITISQPGSYRLTGNITIPDAHTTAIDITADFVTIDLNGFSIIGPLNCTGAIPAVCPAEAEGVGIHADRIGGTPAPEGIRITNGAVRGMGSTGIFLTGEGSLVERVTAESNGGFGFLIAGSVIQSAALRNGSAGIFALIIRECSAIGNQKNGIMVDAMGGVAVGNVSSFNGGHGILAPNATVVNNTIVRNVQFGVSATCPSAISGNTIVGNTGGSITTTGTPNCVLSNNATRP